MKKIIKLSLAGLLALSLVACSSGSGETTTSEGGSTAGGTIVVYQNKGEVTGPMQAYADAWGAEHGVNVVVKTCTGSCDYGGGMKSDIAAGEAPDIFIIEGDSGFEIYKDLMEPLDGAAWLDSTDYEFEKDGHVWGFPVAVEGYGLPYNADVLAACGVDPSTLTTISGYRAAFEAIDAKKDELGLTAVVGLPTADGNYWIMGQHDFASYLSSGMGYTDTAVVDAVCRGEVDMDRLNTYADWVELLYTYTDPAMLISGTADEANYAFGAGKYAFIHQGTWCDNPVAEAGGAFEMGFAPYAPLGDTECTGLFAGAPSWYCVNKDSKNLDLVKEYLNDLAGDAGQKMMVEEVGLISAFATCTYKPAGKLSIALSDFIANGGTAYSFTNQYKTPDGFNMNTLGPLYNQYAQYVATDGASGIDKASFVQMYADAIATLK